MFHRLLVPTFFFFIHVLRFFFKNLLCAQTLKLGGVIYLLLGLSLYLQGLLSFWLNQNHAISCSLINKFLGERFMEQRSAQNQFQIAYILMYHQTALMHLFTCLIILQFISQELIEKFSILRSCRYSSAPFLQIQNYISMLISPSQLLIYAISLQNMVLYKKALCSKKCTFKPELFFSMFRFVNFLLLYI